MIVDKEVLKKEIEKAREEISQILKDIGDEETGVLETAKDCGINLKGCKTAEDRGRAMVNDVDSWDISDVEYLISMAAFVNGMERILNVIEKK